jgi:exodeoxyribonuclease V gamma subunit
MFILHSSNKTENLIAHLTAVINNASLASPFAKEVFLIQSQGMERWFSQQLASQLSVMAVYGPSWGSALPKICCEKDNN